MLCALRRFLAPKHPEVGLLGDRGEANFDKLVCISALCPLQGEYVYNPVLSSPSLVFSPILTGDNFSIICRWHYHWLECTIFSCCVRVSHELEFLQIQLGWIFSCSQLCWHLKSVLPKLGLDCTFSHIVSSKESYSSPRRLTLRLQKLCLLVLWVSAFPSGSNPVLLRLVVLPGCLSSCVLSANKSVLYSIMDGFRVITVVGQSLEGTVAGFQRDTSGENVPDRGERIHMVNRHGGVGGPTMILHGESPGEGKGLV